MKDLKGKAVRGGLAKVGAQGVTLTLRVGSLMVLARLLSPHDFGLVAMVTTLTGVLLLFRDFGLSAATIQQKEVSAQQISTLFWVNMLIGTILSLVTLAAAPAIARFYGEPRLLRVTIILSVVFVVNAAGVQHSALLQRAMRFTTLAAIETASLVVSIVVAISLALAGAGYWALVAMTVTAPVFYSALVWSAARWVPGRPSRSAEVSSMLRFGGLMTLNSVIVYSGYNLEKILLGRFWGAEALGVYGRAYQLVNIPTENLNSSVGEVAFSALSRIKDDPVRWKRYFLKGYSLVVAATMPITVSFVIFAEDIIRVVLGAQWSAAVPIFRLLAPTILVFGMINPLWWLLVSKGLVGRSLKIAMFLAPLMICSYVVGLPYGPTGVALTYSSFMVAWVLPHIAFCVRGTGVSVKDILAAIGRPLTSALVAGLTAAALVHWLGDGFTPLVRLAIGIPVLAAIYVAVLLVAMKQWELYAGLIREVTVRSRSVPTTAQDESEGAGP